MTPLALLAEARARGITMTPEGDRIRCRPGRAVTLELLERIRAVKPAVLAALREEYVTAAYERACREVFGAADFWASTLALQGAPSWRAVSQAAEAAVVEGQRYERGEVDGPEALEAALSRWRSLAAAALTSGTGGTA